MTTVGSQFTAQEFPDTPSDLARLRRYTPFVAAVGKALADARLRHKLQLQELAKRIGSNHGSLSRIEHAKYATTGELARRAVEAMGLDYDAFEQAVWASLTDSDKEGFAAFQPTRRRQLGAPLPDKSGETFISIARELATALAPRNDTTLLQYVDLLEVILESKNPRGFIAAMSAVVR